MKKTWVVLVAGFLACGLVLGLSACPGSNNGHGGGVGKINTKKLVELALGGGGQDLVVLDDPKLQEAMDALDDAGELGASALVPGPICVAGNSNASCTTGTIKWKSVGDACVVTIDDCVIGGDTLTGTITIDLPTLEIVHMVMVLTAPASSTAESWVYIYANGDVAQIVSIALNQYKAMGANSCTVDLTWFIADSCYCLNGEDCGTTVFTDTCEKCLE